MDISSKNLLIENFTKYARSFYSDDLLVHENIVIKEMHTHRVCQLSQMICQSISLDENEERVAFAAALLHDIGRFPQFAKYKTFSDNRSENHAALGVSIIKELGFLSGHPEDDFETIITAVSNHNKREVESNLSERQLLHAKIVRDADKLDIISLLLDYFAVRGQSPKPGLEISLHDTPGFTREIAEKISNLETVDNSMRKNMNDFKIALLSWLPDLNYDFSIKYAVEKSFIRRILSFLPDDDIITRAAKAVDYELERRIVKSV